MESTKPSHRSRLLAKFGLALILLSGVCFVVLLSAPFVPISAGLRVILAGAAFVCMQVAWWTGVALIGPQAVSQAGSWANRFRRGKNTSPENVGDQSIPGDHGDSAKND